MDDKKYVIKRLGNGHMSHMLENANDPTDQVFLCSCGGTRDPRGYCDGTHKEKVQKGCTCQYCQRIEDRTQKVKNA